MKLNRFIPGILICLPVLILVVGLGWEGFAHTQRYNPDSRFCKWKIYRDGGSYEVWEELASERLDMKFDSYTAAKVYQVQQCERMKEMLRVGKKPKPTGVRMY